MRAIRPLNSLLVIFFLIISGCQQNHEPINNIVLKGTTQSLAPISPETKTTTYHNKRYQSVPIEQSSGNPMRDALDALFEDNELEKYYTSLHLAATSKENGESFYRFEGRAKSELQLIEAGFTENFVVAISRNQQGINYSIEFF